MSQELSEKIYDKLLEEISSQGTLPPLLDLYGDGSQWEYNLELFGTMYFIFKAQWDSLDEF
jgi:hypothetical protein